MDGAGQTRDAAGGGVGVQHSFPSGFLNRACRGAELSFRRDNFSGFSGGEDFLDKRLDARLRCLIAGVPLYTLFVPFIFGRCHSIFSFRSPIS